jgi:aerobic carbon-monoxide dehydrogenase medium subunit
VKPPPFDYAAPEHLDEAVGLLAGELDAKVLAGGQSLVPLLSMRLAYPDLLVDLRRIADLDTISESDGRLAIGAMVRQLDAETSETVAARCPLVVEALRHVAHPQIRARGTVGGSIAHADPAGELPAVAVALDASVRVRGPGGERVVPAAELYTGTFTTSLGDGEIVCAVEFPVADDRAGAACVEVARRAGDYALCGAVAQVSTADGLVADARLALFGVADRPVRATAAEAGLRETPVGEAPDLAAAKVAGEIPFRDDPQLPADYRRQVAAVSARRAIAHALEAAA